MATIPIVAGAASLFQGGRVSSPDSQGQATYLSYRAVVNGADILEFQFPQGGQTGLTFGVPLSMFVDNASSDFEMNVLVFGTGQTFVVPANTSGMYTVDAVAGSTIQVTPTGTSSDKVNFIFYNYPRTPFIWYAYGSNVQVSNIPNGADVALGNTADAPLTVAANPGTLISVAKGILNRLTNSFVRMAGTDGITNGIVVKTDASGRLEVIGSAAGGSVYGPDANGTPPTQPPLFIAGYDGANVRRISVTGAGLLQTTVTNNVTVQAGATFPVSQASAWSVDATQTGAWNITNITGTITLPTGAATEASLAKLTLAQGSATAGQTGAMHFGAVTTSEPAYTTAQSNCLSLTTAGRLRVETSPKANATSASGNVAANASNVTIIASNAARKGATVYNDSASATLYLKLGATASATSFTVAMVPGAYYEVPANYTGIIDGIWTAAVGSARYTEIS